MWNNDKCLHECINPIKHQVLKDCIWNTSIRVCEIDEYLENYTYIKCFTDDSVITYDESVDTLDTVTIDSFEQNVKWIIIFFTHFCL